MQVQRHAHRRHKHRPAWVLGALWMLVVLALSSSLVYGLRSYRTLVLLHSAQTLGIPATSSLRAWMTIEYVAATYKANEQELLQRLHLPSTQDHRTTLRALAEQRGVDPFHYVQTVQAAIAEIATGQRAFEVRQEAKGWLGAISDRLLSAILVYGYPALGLTLLLGALGLPVPTGLSLTVAGSLASQGYMDWLLGVALAVATSVLGDFVLYAIGRVASEGFVERWGRWLGYTPNNRARAEALFARWGSVSVLLTRSLVSHLSSIVSLLAGLSHFPLTSFLGFAIVGRAIWTFAYFGLGYTVGTDFEAASGFLGNLSLLLLSIAFLLATAALLFRRRARSGTMG